MNQDSIDKVKEAFTDWRSNRPKQSKIPAYLWDMVKPLMDEYPVSMISRVLGISLTQIRNNISQEKLTFVEAIPLSQSDHGFSDNATLPEHSCDIELKHPSGSVLKINALPISAISTLLLSFLDKPCCS